MCWEKSTNPDNSIVTYFEAKCAQIKEKLQIQTHWETLMKPEYCMASLTNPDALSMDWQQWIQKCRAMLKHSDGCGAALTNSYAMSNMTPETSYAISNADKSRWLWVDAKKSRCSETRASSTKPYLLINTDKSRQHQSNCGEYRCTKSG